uniref:Uncharacterized protein n=1 Tax=Helianthus annuus TaxID=4232 RepID=A0A251STC3_HELAN
MMVSSSNCIEKKTTKLTADFNFGTCRSKNMIVFEGLIVKFGVTETLDGGFGLKKVV